MANLAIKGHATRGEEAIEILEMLGGKNVYQYEGYNVVSCLFIDEVTNAIHSELLATIYCKRNVKHHILTLEEFLEKFPYKVGDRVRIPEYDSKVCICKMRWNSLYNYMEYLVNRDDTPEWYTTKVLLDYNDDFLIDKEHNNMGKINIAEILKDCPSGMELDSTMYDGVVTFEKIDENSKYPIVIRVLHNGNINIYKLIETGQPCMASDTKCVIFPKGKTTWEGFVPPCKFNDGDVIFTHTNALKCNLDNNWVSIFKEYRNNRCACYVCLCLSDLELYHDKWEDELLCELCEIEESRLATEEEKQKLFDAIRENGYRWNDETKTLEELFVTKFKVGDRIKHKVTGSIYTVIFVRSNEYDVAVTNEIGKSISIEAQDHYELLPNKFDIFTLKPFDKVLVRHNNNEKWDIDFFSCIDNGKTFITITGVYTQCIPFEGNEHLLNTTVRSDNYYETWEE